MVNVMLNSIALEPNRFTAEKTPHLDVTKLLPMIAKAGFTAIEMWQYHISGKTLEEVKAVRQRGDSLGLTFPVFGAYPVFHLEGEDAEKEIASQMGLLERAEILGSSVIKMFLGKIKGSEITPEQLKLTDERVGSWTAAAKARNIRFCAELHDNTLFDPEETGEAFLAHNPDLGMGVCYQPYDFQNTDACLALADRFAGRIIHVHLQGHGADNGHATPWGQNLCSLEESAIDYCQLLPRINDANPGVTYGIEFVRSGMGPAEELDYNVALAEALKDKVFAEAILDKQMAIETVPLELGDGTTTSSRM